MSNASLHRSDPHVHHHHPQPIALVRALRAATEAAEATAIRFVEAHDGDLDEIGDAVADDLEKAFEGLDDALDGDDLDALRAGFAQVAALSLTWLARDAARRGT